MSEAELEPISPGRNLLGCLFVALLGPLLATGVFFLFFGWLMSGGDPRHREADPVAHVPPVNDAPVATAPVEDVTGPVEEIGAPMEDVEAPVAEVEAPVVDAP